MTFKHATNVLLMALLFLGVLIVYSAWYSYVKGESAKAATLAAQLQTQAQSAERAEAAKDELGRITSDQAALSGYFVQTANIVPFLESLQGTGAKLGSAVKVVSVSSQTGTPHDYLNLSVQIVGPFDSVMRTLGALEYGPYDIALSSLTLDTPGNGNAAPEWTASAAFRVGTEDAAPEKPAPSASTTSAASAASTTSP